ncbi:MAG: hypothetical protein HYY42_04515, partial [Chloroflexi bacterium]|nr:hypothetical protein [Chloroflexota bacterium]
GWQLILGVPAAVMGYLIATRRPPVPTGWLLLAFGVINCVDGSAREIIQQDERIVVRELIFRRLHYVAR